MQKKLFGWVMAIFTLSLFMTSCDNEIICWNTMVPPPAIALRITVNNQASTTATVKIRHARLFSEAGTDWVLSGWDETVTVEHGGTQWLGNETARYQYKNKEQEMRGFILWKESTAEQFKLLAGKSSFELEIALEGRTIRLAGYPTKESGFTKTELCWLHIERFSETAPDRVVHLWSEGNGAFILEPYVIPATLTLNAGGSYSFNFDEDMHWHTLAVW